MKKLVSLLAVSLLFCFCLSAQAATKEYAKFKLNVPDGWTETAHGDMGAEFVAPDKSAKFGVAIIPLNGKSVEELANEAAKAANATLEKDADGDYMFTYTEDGKEGIAIVSEGDGEIVVMSILGEHADLEGMIESLEEK